MSSIGRLTADGSDPQPLPMDLQPSPDKPSWSPDGTKLAFTYGYVGSDRCQRYSGIAVLNLATGKARVLVDNGERPAWSRDGKHILFIREVWKPHDGRELVQEEVWVARADGGVPWRVAGAPRVFAADWVPDGRILLSLGVPEEQPVVAADEDSGVIRGPFPGRGCPGTVGRPIGYRTHLWLVRADGTNPHPLGEGDRFEDLSPDGYWLVYQANWDIWIRRIDGAHEQNLTNTPDVWEYSPDWGLKGLEQP